MTVDFENQSHTNARVVRAQYDLGREKQRICMNDQLAHYIFGLRMSFSLGSCLFLPFSAPDDGTVSLDTYAEAATATQAGQSVLFMDTRYVR